MSRWTPCKRRDFIRRLRVLGFNGPLAGTRHSFMIHECHRLTIPSNTEYSVDQLRMMMAEVETILGRSLTSDESLRVLAAQRSPDSYVAGGALNRAGPPFFR